VRAGVTATAAPPAGRRLSGSQSTPLAAPAETAAAVLDELCALELVPRLCLGLYFRLPALELAWNVAAEADWIALAPRNTHVVYLPSVLGEELGLYCHTEDDTTPAAAETEPNGYPQADREI